MTPLIALLLTTAGVITPTSAASFDEWPVEYVLRPQTIPTGWVRASLSGAAFIPDGDYRTPTGDRLAYALTFGGGLAVGVTSRIEGQIVPPRLACVSAGDSTVCPSSRLLGSGLGMSVGVVRTRPLQLRIATFAYVATSQPQPTTFALSVSSRVKWLVAERLALELDLAVNKRLQQLPGSGYDVGSGSLTLDVNFQVARHLLVFADAYPYAPLNRLNHPRLELLCGASWTFENGVQIGVGGGVYNVLPRRPDDLAVPGEFVSSYVAFWL